MLNPVLRKKTMEWKHVGSVTDFPAGITKMVTYENPRPFEWGKKISQSAAYVRQEKEGEFVAFTVNCSHLGCPVRWFQKPEMFLCPCHGGAFYKDGSRAAGRPTKGLEKYDIRVVNGNVEVKTEAIPITTLG